MASITISSNGTEIFKKLAGNLKALQDPSFLRPVCVELIDGMIKPRIHENGTDADGKPIGTYSAPYLKYQRKKYKRGPSPTVIVSLTRKLENSWAPIATPTGYAIGFVDAGGGDGGEVSGKKVVSSKQKLEFVAKIKGANLTNLSKEELEYAIERIKELVNEEFSN